MTDSHPIALDSLGVLLVLASFSVFMAGDAIRAGLPVLYYLLANTIVVADGLDFGIRLIAMRRSAALRTSDAPSARRLLSVDPAALGADSALASVAGVRPFAIIASVFNLGERVDEFMENLAPLRDKVWVISDGSTDDTVARLRRADWRCLDGGTNQKKPRAIARLLKSLPEAIQTVLVIDPDARICERRSANAVSLERIVADFQGSGAAAACPRVRVAHDGFLGRFQSLEYLISFGLGRRSLADHTIASGIALYRRDALEAALADHSGSVYAEDLENTLILLSRGERVYYDGRLVVDVVGPTSIRQLFSQRVGWYYGYLRVYLQRFREVRQVGSRGPLAAYHYLGYMGVLTLGLHPFKVAGAGLLLASAANLVARLFGFGRLLPWPIADSTYLAVAVANYALFTCLVMITIVPRAEWRYPAPAVPLYFLYALFQLVPITIGYANWVSLRLAGRRLYRDHYDSDERLRGTVAVVTRPAPGTR